MITFTLSSIIEEWGGLIQTGPFGSQLHQYDYSEVGVPVVMPKDIRNGRVDESRIARIPKNKADQLSRHFLKAGSVVFPRRGEISKCAYINEEQAGFLCGTGCIKIEPPEDRLRSKFLFYYLGLRQSVEWLERNAVGTTMHNLSTKILGGLSVPLLPLKMQDGIVSILSAYDNLIENNRRRIQLLEQSARLLYKEWFINLRFPGHEHTKIIDGVPEGWERKMLGDVSATNVESYKANKLPNEINYIDIASVKKGRILSKKKMLSSEAPGRARRKGANGDVIWSNVRPNLRAYALVLEPDENDVFSTGFTIMSSTVIPFSYLYLFVTSEEFVSHLVNHTTGTSYPAVRSDDFERAEIFLPAQSLLKIFHVKMLPVFRMIQVLEKEINALSNARDILLPKLMTGEMAV